MPSLAIDEVIRLFLSRLIEHGELERERRGGAMVMRPASLLEPSAELIYHRRETRGGRRPWGPVSMVHYLKDRKLFLVNGDGFTDNNATRWQTYIRTELQTRIRQEAIQQRPVPHVMLVPFVALSAAGVEFSSIRPLHVSDDTWDVIWHAVPDPGEFKAEDWGEPVRSTTWQRTLQREIKGVRFQTATVPTRRYRNKKTGEISRHVPPDWNYVSAVRETHEEVVEWAQPPHGTPYSVFATARDETTDWRPTDRAGNLRAVVRNRELRERGGGDRVAFISEHPFTVDEDGNPIRVEHEEIGWIEEAHHLGASIFSGRGEDGKRHKYISAFDRDDPQPLYFLAQLPDRSGATTFDEAIASLKPALVAQAEKDGMRVYRQGDVFAIETELTDEQVYAGARSVVRREVVMFDFARNMHAIAAGREIPAPLAHEVSETIDCPCQCGHKRKVGFGPKARRALSIYRTGHTASEVVVGPKGETYIKGNMFHDPAIEEPGREREHRTIQLVGIMRNGRIRSTEKWFLAVRNTVPRRRRRRDQAQDTVEAEAQS